MFWGFFFKKRGDFLHDIWKQPANLSTVVANSNSNGVWNKRCERVPSWNSRFVVEDKRKKCKVLSFDKAMEAVQEVELTENGSTAEANKNNNRAASNYVEVA